MSLVPALTRRLASERLVRNNAIYLTGTLAAGSLGYVYHFVNARLLGPVGYSAVASAVAALYLLTLPGPVLQTVAMRFAGRALGRGDPDQVRQVVLRTGVLGLVLGLGVAITLILLAPAAAGYLQLPDNRFVYALAIASFAGMLVAGNRGVIQGLQRFVALSLNVVLDNASRVVVSVTAIALDFGALGAVAALAVGPAIAWAQSSWMLARVRGSGGAHSTLGYGEVGRYAVFAAIGVMGVTFLFNADVLLVKHYLSPEMAGIYGAGSVLGRVVYFLGLTVAGVMFPEVVALHARDEAHFHVVDLSLLFVGAVSVVFVAIYTAVPQLVLFPLGASFAFSRPLLGPFALALSLLTVANLLVNYFLSVNNVRFVLPLVMSCVLEVALIGMFHDSPAQVVRVVVITMAALATAMSGLYAFDRIKVLRVTKSGRA